MHIAQKSLLLAVTIFTLMVSGAYLSLAAPGAEFPVGGDCASTPSDHVQWLDGGALTDELEVLSWNIQKAAHADWADDLTSFSHGVHLAFIQEASLEADIANAIPGELHRAFAPGYSTAQLQTGVLTLSSSAPNSRCRMTALEPWLGTPKATSVTRYSLGAADRRLLAINLHAVNFELGLTTFANQFHALRTVLDDHDGPVIIAGDLNTWSADRQTVVDALMSEYGLTAVTFKPDLRTRAFGRALDHIYVRGLKANDARVIPVTSSDHNPLRVSFRII